MTKIQITVLLFLFLISKYLSFRPLTTWKKGSASSTVMLKSEAADEPSEPISSTSSVLLQYKDDFEKLRGTAELVDRLENLAGRYPGIEVYRVALSISPVIPLLC